MEWAQLPAIIAAVSGVLVVFGAGIKFMLNRIDKNDADQKAWEANERAKLEKQFQDQIDTLKGEIAFNQAEIGRMRSDLTSYVRHVGVLEGLLKANGIEVPAFPRNAA